MAPKPQMSQSVMMEIVAKLAEKYGADFRQSKVAKQLGVSQPTISRLLKDAERTEGILVQELRFVGELSDEASAVLERLERNDSTILNKLRSLEPDPENPVLREIEVYDLDIDLKPPAETLSHDRREEDRRKQQEQFLRFGVGAGAVLSRWLTRVDAIGITWGASAYFATLNIDAKIFAKKQPRFFPTCGNIRTGRGQFTSTTICENLSLRISGDAQSAIGNSLAVNAFIPWEYSSDTVLPGQTESELNKFAQIMLESSEAYQRILGGYRDRAPDHPATQFGTLITGIGEDENCYGRNFNDFMRIARPRDGVRTADTPISEDEITRFFSGDFAGNLLERPNLDLSDADHKRIARIRSLWTGIRIENIREIARRANDDDRQGVIVLGAGSNKVETLMQAIRNGLVSKAIVDSHLMSALEKALKRI